ncbi:hypothetical protein JW935_14505 [candidate division KSB1 bacterium]|nr:hypothetical protein [candidate division KSB1 bacterium]
MYYPMRCIRTTQYKYILNLFPELAFPFASDLYASKTWQDILKSKTKTMGRRKVSDYLHRPPEELYDLQSDPYEVKNLVKKTKYHAVLNRLRE